MAQEGSGHPVEVGGRAHRVVAAPAVDVDVHVPRRDERPARLRLVELDRGDPAVLDRDPPGRDPVVEDEAPADDLRLVAHRPSSPSVVIGQTTYGRSTSRASRKPRFTSSSVPSKPRSSCSTMTSPS